MKLATRILLLIALYLYSYYFYIGILRPIPALGDSWSYHIPISVSILNGGFLFAKHFRSPQEYFPGSSEAINSLFILLHIPLTLSNFFAIVVLFFCLWKLARTFQLSYYFSLFFALTFCTLNVIVRWLNAVSIDVWLAIFFILGIILLEKPKQTLFYFFKLGFVMGMLIGSKITAWYYVFLLFAFYWKNILTALSLFKTKKQSKKALTIFYKIILFLIPFSIFGLFWYFRNYNLTGNPFYPIPMLGFHGPLTYSDTVWKALTNDPRGMFDAFFGEYRLWMLSVLIAILYFIMRIILKKRAIPYVDKLFAIGLISFAFFLRFPSSVKPSDEVSCLRYSFPIFIVLMLGVFLIVQKYKKEQLITYLAIGSLLPTLAMSYEYYPKLLLFYMPLAFFLFYLINKKEPLEKLSKKKSAD